MFKAPGVRILCLQLKDSDMRVPKHEVFALCFLDYSAIAECVQTTKRVLALGQALDLAISPTRGAPFWIPAIR